VPAAHERAPRGSSRSRAARCADAASASAARRSWRRRRWAASMAAWTASAAVAWAPSLLPASSSVASASHRERAARVSGCRSVSRIIWIGSSV
jgi:hypothetical protein